MTVSQALLGLAVVLAVATTFATVQPYYGAQRDKRRAKEFQKTLVRILRAGGGISPTDVVGDLLTSLSVEQYSRLTPVEAQLLHQILDSLRSPSLDSRPGQGPDHERLVRELQNQDQSPWLRLNAADALAEMGDTARALFGIISLQEQHRSDVLLQRAITQLLIRMALRPRHL